MSLRLRSNSGLSLHTNEDAFRRYTDYNPDGSPRSPTFGPGIWSSLDSVSTSLRRSFAPTVMEVEPDMLTIPDLLGREVFQMVLTDAATSQRFFQFAKNRGCGPDIEFLLRVQEYSRSLTHFGKQASSMMTPTNLPSSVSKSLNTDMKQLTNSVLPGLETLFVESTRCVEQRVSRTIYPAYVKHQLALCTSASLTGNRSLSYPGLAESFCLTDVLIPDNPIIAASDAFVSITGYSKMEALPKNCRFLQGTLTDRDAIKRIQDAVSRGEESLELVLNYRRDGSPFWNLLFTCPLLDASGTVRYYLGGQINVSENAGEYKDLVRFLNFGPALEETKDESSGRESRTSRRMSRANSRDTKQERRASLRNRDSLHNKGPPKKSIFQPFRKHGRHHSITQEKSGPPLSIGLGLDSFLRVSRSEERLPLPAQTQSAFPAYSRMIVLQNTECQVGFPPRTSSLPADPSKRKVAQLSVAFCSAPALEALGLELFADSIMHRDIFAVLSELADSPSITKSFKNTVRERIVRDGKSAALDIMLGGGYLARKGSLIGLGGRSFKDDSDINTKKHGRPASRTGFASLVGEAGKMEKLTSYWTPLKNAEDQVEWIVLIIAPTR